VSPRKQKRSYLNRENQWSEQPAGAVLSLTSVIDGGRAYNQLYQLTGGRWVPVTEGTKLSGVQRGLSFTVTQTKRPAGTLVLFTSPGFIDAAFWQSFLTELTVYTFEGAQTNDPAELMDHFALSAKDAKTFVKRLEAVGGELKRGDAQNLSQAKQQLQEIINIHTSLDKVLETDLQFLNTQQQNNGRGDILDFNQRGDDFKQLLRQGFDRISALEKHLTDSQENHVQGEVFLQLKTQLQEQKDALEEIRTARDRAEKIAGDLASQAPPTTQRLTMSERVLLKDLTIMLDKRGIRCREEEDQLLIELDSDNELILDQHGLRRHSA